MHASRRLWLVITIFLLAGCADQPGILIEEAWVRAADQGDNSAAYFLIQNHGSADQLLSVDSEVSEQVQIHRTILDEEGVARMVQQARIPIAANDQTLFEPGGYHVMLVSLKQPLRAGDSIELTLHFERSGSYGIEAEIRNP